MGGLLGLFLNPWALAGAGLLASVPVIIHLINRMRYRRVRWAAMEFLLAAQKRMKRKMIIEQLLLLASRVLLILLIGLLLSRWLLSGSPPVPPEDWILHEVVLDDSASMADVAKDSGTGGDSFSVAKDGIRVLAESTLTSKTPTRIRLRRASEPGMVLFDEQMADDSFGSLTTILEGAKLRPFRVDIGDALDKAKAELVAQYPELRTKKNLHLFSDIRKGDWADGKIRSGLTSTDGVLWRLHDCALPNRTEESRPESHGNLAILALGSESRLALEGQPLECWAKIANFGTQARSAFLAVELNGRRDPAASRQVESLPPGQVVEVRFRVIPPPAPGKESGANDAKPTQSETKDPVKDGLARRARGTSLAVRAILENDSGEGLFSDNLRDMVLEVRDRIPILVVDGTILPGASTSSDSLYFGAALNPQLFDPLFLEPADLEKQDLPSFALVVLLNVGELTDNAVGKLGEFVKGGGGLAWFAGDRTVPAFCNKTFELDGLFPLLLAGQPSPPLSEKDREDLRRDDSPKVVFPDPSSPVVAGLLPFRPVFRHLRMERHWPSIEASRWTDQVETLLALPSKGWQIAGQRESMKREILDILALDKAPFTSPSLAPVLGILESEVGKARSKIATLGQFEIVAALEDLLRIQSSGEGNRPGIGIWDRPELRDTQAKLRAAIRKIQQGDPLLVSRKVGRGSVLAFLSSAGPSSSRSNLTGESPGIWNEWANGFLSATFPILVQDSLFYLLRQQSDARGLSFAPVQVAEVGAFPSPVLVESFYFPQKAGPTAASSQGSAKVAQIAAKLIQSQGVSGPGLWSLQIEPQDNPGLLTYALKPDSASAQQIRGGLTFNVDTVESDLERASREEVDPRLEKTGQVSTPEDWFVLDSAGAKSESAKQPGLSDRPLDASETPWLIIALLALLLLEQFLAWRCSHLQPVGANIPEKGVV